MKFLYSVDYRMVVYFQVCTVSEEEILHMEGFDSEEGHIAEEVQCIYIHVG